MVTSPVQMRQTVSGTATLMGGSKPFEGNVFVADSKGKLGPVCDSQWDKHDADVVCKQLGYGGGGIPTNGE